MAQSTASLEGQYQPSQANLRETMFTAHGVGVVKGIAIGRAVVMGIAALEVPHYYIVHEAVAQELERLAHAIARVQQELDSQIERSEEHTSELQSRGHLVCRLLLEKIYII